MNKFIKIICFSLLTLKGATHAMDAKLVFNPFQIPLNDQFLSAIRRGNHSEVKQLLDAGSDVNQGDRDLFGGKITALMIAAEGNHYSICELLIQAGADINHAGSRGQTALMHAAYQGHARCVSLLINAKVNLDAEDEWGQTALIMAAQNCEYNCVQLLINAGADVNHKDKLGRLALLWAGKLTQPVYELLVEKMLDTPKEKIYPFIYCLKQSFNAGTYHNLHDIFQPLLNDVVAKNNARVRKEINVLSDGSIKQHLLNKYFPKSTPSDGATN